MELSHEYLVKIDTDNNVTREKCSQFKRKNELYYEELNQEPTKEPLILDGDESINDFYWGVKINNTKFFGVKGTQSLNSKKIKKYFLNRCNRIYNISMIPEPDNNSSLHGLPKFLEKNINYIDLSGNTPSFKKNIQNINYIGLDYISLQNGTKYIVDKLSKKLILMLLKTTYLIYKSQQNNKNNKKICMSCRHIRTRTPAFIATYAITTEGVSFENINDKLNSLEYIKKYSSGGWDRNGRIKNCVIFIDIIALYLKRNPPDIINFIELILKDNSSYLINDPTSRVTNLSESNLLMNFVLNASSAPHSPQLQLASSSSSALHVPHKLVNSTINMSINIKYIKQEILNKLSQSNATNSYHLNYLIKFCSNYDSNTPRNAFINWDIIYKCIIKSKYTYILLNMLDNGKIFTVKYNKNGKFFNDTLSSKLYNSPYKIFNLLIINNNTDKLEDSDREITQVPKYGIKRMTTSPTKYVAEPASSKSSGDFSDYQQKEKKQKCEKAINIIGDIVILKEDTKIFKKDIINNNIFIRDCKLLYYSECKGVPDNTGFVQYYCTCYPIILTQYLSNNNYKFKIDFNTKIEKIEYSSINNFIETCSYYNKICTKCEIINKNTVIIEF